MIVCVFLLILTTPICLGSLHYPPLYWHKDDCRFQQVQRMPDSSNVTKELFMKVIFSVKPQPIGPYCLAINCPTTHMNNWMKEEVDDDSFIENLWQVDKEGYDKCKVNTKGDPNVNRLLLTCNDKNKINIKTFIFMNNFGAEDLFTPAFKPGNHYYFISTSIGEPSVLETRTYSGRDGSCEKHHMKLHIYVCVPGKEDCIYEMPKCGPPPELFRDMHLIDGKLPAPTRKPASEIVPKVRTPPKTEAKNDRQVMQRTTPRNDIEGEKTPICKEEEKGTSVQLILNFVLGGVALFMAVVIIILVCGLSDKNKTYEVERPHSAISTAHPHIVNAEIVQYSDGHVELSPVIVSRTPPTSPNMIIPPFPSLQRVPSQRQSNTPSDNHKVPLEDTPPERSLLETPLSEEPRAFAFPDEPLDSEATSDGVESSESEPTTTAIVTNPRHDHELNT